MKREASVSLPGISWLASTVATAKLRNYTKKLKIKLRCVCVFFSSFFFDMLQKSNAWYAVKTRNTGDDVIHRAHGVTMAFAVTDGDDI